MGWPSTLTMMSPGLSPALAAGEFASAAARFRFRSARPSPRIRRRSLDRAPASRVNSLRSPLRTIQTLRGWSGAGHLFQSRCLPRWDSTVSPICTMRSPSCNPALAAALLGHDVADLGRRRGGNLGEADHEEAGEHRHGQNDVHGRPGEQDDQTLPARLALETARIAGVLVAGLLAHHLDVAAQQNRRKSENRFRLS